MLKKCLKYDLKATFMPWAIGTVGVLSLSVPAGISMQIVTQTTNSPFRTPALICVSLYFMLLFAYFIYGIGAGVYRFYQNFRTDEAYLTFTLPVKRSTLLQSKILATLSMFSASILVMFISLSIFLCFVPNGDVSTMASIISNIKESIVESKGPMQAFVPFYVLGIVCLAFSVIVAAILFFFTITDIWSKSSTHSKKTMRNIILPLAVYVTFVLFIIAIVVIIVSLLTYREMTEALGSVSPLEARFIGLLGIIILNMVVILINMLMYSYNISSIRSKLNLA